MPHLTEIDPGAEMHRDFYFYTKINKSSFGDKYNKRIMHWSLTMSEIETKLALVEAEKLDVHVAANHERFKNIDQSIARVETQIEKNHTDIKEDISELKKVVVWAVSTLFGTMLIALLTSVFKVTL